MDKELTESLWISKNQAKLSCYAGKWIAVLKDKVVASGENLLEIVKKCRAKRIKGDPLFIKMPRPDEGMYVL